jgi:hypothetical protein
VVVRKNKYKTIFWAIIPGAGHVYLGLYKRAARVAGIFFGSFVLASFILYLMNSNGLLQNFLGLIIFIIYLWTFNDALILGKNINTNIQD